MLSRMVRARSSPRRALLLGLAAEPGQLQLRGDAGQQLAGAERLGQVVVGPGLQALDAGLLAGPGREQDHRQVPRPGVGPQLRSRPKPSSPGIITSVRIRSGGSSPGRRERRQAVGDRPTS